HAGNLVPQDLRLIGQRDGPSPRVAVVVGVPGGDVEVGATETDRRHAHEDFARSGSLAGDISHVDPPDVNEHGSSHRHPDPAEPPPSSRTSTAAIVLGGTLGS